MKIFYVLFVIIICFIASCTEVTNPSYIDDIQDYMPLSIGNYWVYDVFDSLNYVGHIDSMVVVSDTMIKFKPMYVVHNFRDGIIRDTGYYCITDNSISMYGKILMPLFWTPDSACFSGHTKKLFSILDFRNKWSCRDSILGDLYPSLIPDPDDPTGWSITNTKTVHILTIQSKRDELERTFFNNNSHKMINVVFNCIRKYRILEPDSVQFTVIDGYEYFENNRVVIANKFHLNLQFAKGIGIIYLYEKSPLQWKYCQTRKLKRYKVMHQPTGKPAS